MVSTQNTTSQTETPQRITPATFSAEEIIATFNSILSTMDFTPMLEALGIAKHHIFRKKKATRELKALSISLWKLALQQSFPADAESFYDSYLDTEPALSSKSKDGNLFKARVNTYNELLKEKGEKDFTPVAKYLADIFTDNENTSKKFTLRLSLLLRNTYGIIFDNLV